MARCLSPASPPSRRVRRIREAAPQRRVEVREASRADVKAFLRLLVALAEFERLEPPAQDARRRIVRDVFENRRVRLLLAFSGGRAVGYALYFYAYSSFLARPTLYLEDVFVLDDFRRAGVGRRLLMACAEEARRRGCGRMEWAVLKWNKGAIRFYEGLGAKRLSDWSVYRLDSAALARFLRGRGAQ